MCSEFPIRNISVNFFDESKKRTKYAGPANISVLGSFLLKKEPSTLVLKGPAYLVVFSKNNEKMSAEGRLYPHAIDPLIKREDCQSPTIPKKKFHKKWNFSNFLAIFHSEKSPKIAEGDFQNWPSKRCRAKRDPKKYQKSKWYTKKKKKKKMGSQSGILRPTFCTNFVHFFNA